MPSRSSSPFTNGTVSVGLAAQVACLHALIRMKLYGVDKFAGPLKLVPTQSKRLKMVFKPRRAFDVENVYFGVGGAYPLQVCVTGVVV